MDASVDLRTNPQTPVLKGAEMGNKLVTVGLQDPPDDSNTLGAKRVPHMKQQDTGVWLSGLVGQHAEVVILRDEDSLFAHRPIENRGIWHVRVHIASEDSVVPILLKGLRYATTDIVVDKELHTGRG